MKKEVISPDQIKVGDLIEDKRGTRGVVVENMHPWGWPRLQYSGLSIINHPDPEWYSKITDLSE